jgi:hypothetical protein
LKLFLPCCAQILQFFIDRHFFCACAAGAEGGEEGAGGDDWDEGIRAPLVVAALDAIARVDRSALATELRSLFPALTRLMCSSQPCVREALSALLQQQLPQLLPASPAAGA